MRWEKPCSRCGILIKEGESNIHVQRSSEEETDLLSWMIFAKVWHKACYDRDLEEGESSD